MSQGSKYISKLSINNIRYQVHKSVSNYRRTTIMFYCYFTKHLSSSRAKFCCHNKAHILLQKKKQSAPVNTICEREKKI